MSFPLKVLITAGPTREMLDPVRFISNVSTGEMGYAIARAALKRRHYVTLVSGPTALKPPSKAGFVPILSASNLRKVCEREFPKHDVLIMVAAVCDFTADHQQAHKIRRTSTKQLKLRQTPDIVACLSKAKGKRTAIGFCLETEKWLDNAKAKLKRKHLDGIVANYYTKSHIPFGDRKINTAFLSSDGEIKRLYKKSKSEIARDLLIWVEGIASKKSFRKTQK